jgi:hypothetical protein
MSIVGYDGTVYPHSIVEQDSATYFLGRSRVGEREHDRKCYFFDAVLGMVPLSDALDYAALPGLLAQFDARQVLHVAFGTILSTYGETIRATFAAHEAV